MLTHPVLNFLWNSFSNITSNVTSTPTIHKNIIPTYVTKFSLNFKILDIERKLEMIIILSESCQAAASLYRYISRVAFWSRVKSWLGTDVEERPSIAPENKVYIFRRVNESGTHARDLAELMVPLDLASFLLSKCKFLPSTVGWITN